ncbi:MAG: hypothetical protein INR70_27285 [Parafilimonas terrae]|nr:hypothetical protein [Parafilimonas terrae]
MRRTRRENRRGAGLGGLAAFGLLLAVVGWVVLVLDLFVAEALLQAGNLVTVTALRGDVATLSQTAVLTGIGLALLGTLRQGLGRLNGYFEMVLGPADLPARPAPAPATPPRTEPVPPAPPPIIEGRAAAAGPAGRDRNYVILPDGSVEVETLLGTRVFASLDEARDFIR